MNRFTTVSTKISVEHDLEGFCSWSYNQNRYVLDRPWILEEVPA